MVENLPVNTGDAGDAGSVLGLGRPPGGGSGNPPQCPWLQSRTGRGAWQAAVLGARESQTGLSAWAHRWLTRLCWFWVYSEGISYTCVLSRSVVPDSLRPRGLEPARLLCPWDSPGRNTGVGCRFLLQGIFPTQGLSLSPLCPLHGQEATLPQCHPTQKPILTVVCVYI